ncbi:hypothetical protein WJX74_000925 [Apatococcus lobatus]|uniref:Expansin-like EG45 domain-containing protein n=1 Tax=Apatococcus lobatus TaxID=904363 RepID=A0AAW1QUF4_9CHLO
MTDFRLFGVLLIIALSSVTPTTADSNAVALSDWIPGILTPYGGDEPTVPSYGVTIGSCGYDDIMQDSWPYWSVAALATSNSFHLAGPDLGCGQCFQIQCINNGPTFVGKCHDNWENNSITVMITDECPECAPDQIDVQALSFDKIAPLINGRIQTQYRRVTCTPPDAAWVRIDGNNGPGLWLRLWIVNVAGSGGVTAVSIRGPDQVEYPMTNTFGAAWEIGSAPQFPADLIVSTDDSQQLIFFGAVTVGQTGYVQTASQFISTPTAWPTAPAFNNDVAVASYSTAVTVTSGTLISNATAATESYCPPTCDTCLDINFALHNYTCAQQKAFGKCNDNFLTQPLHPLDATAEGVNITAGYCARTCGRCSCTAEA